MLYYRILKGKEDKKRYREKLGNYQTAIKRPAGFVLRIHGASVGETLSALPLIDKLLSFHADIHIIVTSNTITSAQLMHDKLPKRCFHIFAPLDTPQAVKKFYQTYKPNLEIVLDSEIFPNALMTAFHHQIPVFGVNTRLSDKSMARWHKGKIFLKHILQAYKHFFVQNEKIAVFLSHYFNGDITICDNLKWAMVAPKPHDAILLPLTEYCKNRFIVCLLSTHPHEEKDCVEALINQGFFNISSNLLIIVPRHPHRKNQILADLIPVFNGTIKSRSETDIIHQDTQIYIADTLGETILWSHLSDVIFMGNSLSTVGGGHNPIEPAHIGKPIIVGNKINNFTEIYAILKHNDACIFTETPYDLAKKIMLLQEYPDLRKRLCINSLEICQKYREKSLICADYINNVITEIKPYAKP